ncbi:MAG TPA: hypothetical protein VIJ11_03690 [Galbitalea sp.]
MNATVLLPVGAKLKNRYYGVESIRKGADGRLSVVIYATGDGDVAPATRRSE